jgi:hypothetical protein
MGRGWEGSVDGWIDRLTDLGKEVVVALERFRGTEQSSTAAVG